MAILGRSARSHLTVQRQWPRSKVTEVEVSDRAGVGTTKPHCLKPRTESSPRQWVSFPKKRAEPFSHEWPQKEGGSG